MELTVITRTIAITEKQTCYPAKLVTIFGRRPGKLGVVIIKINGQEFRTEPGQDVDIQVFSQ